MKHSPGFLKLVTSAKKHVKEISVAKVKEQKKLRHDFVMVDVRQEHEWKEGTFPAQSS